MESPAETSSTADRILDVAENLFAAKGYKAASLIELAEQVGIRPPSLYNHFRNKESLYKAVLERLLGHFQPLIAEAATFSPHDKNAVLAWTRQMVELHFRHPNFARLLQHAALAEAPGTTEMLTRFFRPLFAPSAGGGVTLSPPLLPWATMAFHNVLVSYITMAPLYRNLINQDPFSAEARQRHLEMVLEMVNSALTRPESPFASAA